MHTILCCTKSKKRIVLTVLSLFVKCTIHPSFSHCPSFFLVCLTDCTILMSGIFALGDDDELQCWDPEPSLSSSIEITRGGSWWQVIGVYDDFTSFSHSVFNFLLFMILWPSMFSFWFWYNIYNYHNRRWFIYLILFVLALCV